MPLNEEGEVKSRSSPVHEMEIVNDCTLFVTLNPCPPALPPAPKPT
jgi:tRNA(Arg) A34 adenosine deaminase TadA